MTVAGDRVPVALMRPGDEVYVDGEWVRIIEWHRAPGGRARMVMADGTERLASLDARRLHRRSNSTSTPAPTVSV